MIRGAVRALLAAGLWLSVPGAARAEVVDTGAQGFTLKTTVQIARPPDQVYAGLIDVGQWWGKEHTYSGDSRNMTIDARPGGCFCEKLPGGGGVEHGRVVNAMPGSLLRLNTALGPLQELAVTGSWSWQITASGGQSAVTMTYAVAGHVPGGFAKLAPLVDQVLSEQIGFLKAWMERPAR